MSIPSFLLKKLYVKGSLKNTESGFELALRNNLAPGTVIGLGGLTIDDNTYPPAAITMKSAQGEVKGNEISSQTPAAFPVNIDVKIEVEGAPLTPGEHHMVFSVLTREIGRIEFDLTDTL